MAAAPGARATAAPALRPARYSEEPVSDPAPLAEELRRFAPAALRTAGVVLVAGLLIWGVGSAPGLRNAALPAGEPLALPQDRTFTAELLLPAAAADPVVAARSAELAVVNPANQQSGSAAQPATLATPAAVVAVAPAGPAAPAAAPFDAVESAPALQPSARGLVAQATALPPAPATEGASAGALEWPLAIEIVTPTPDSAAERRLFAEPLVAQQRSEAAAMAPIVGDLQEPILLPALAAEANGGLAVAAPSLDDLALPRILPAVEFAPLLGIATPQATPVPVPTLPPIVLEPGRAWSTFIPGPESTHFWVGRPHPDFVANQIAAPSYQFGSTAGGRYRPHHGMDIANSSGTPVRAATTGEVVHAGPDDPDVLGPYPNFYGNAVVIRLDRRLSVASGEMDVYLLYGHLSEVTVQKGQRVQPDDLVGAVGMTGIAIGPHLHVEMRVGSNVYEASVNPYLWVAPPPGHGAVAARVLTADGRTWPNARLTLARFDGNVATWARVLEIYPDNESINPDPAFGENGAMEAVPAGSYLLVGSVNGERVAAEVVVEAGKTSFVELRTAN
jgi:murein DD-endopeptidase MepM/ murein hydrolase activator NlpD